VQDFHDDNLSTVNLHGFEDEYKENDPFPWLLRGHSSRRKWIILGSIVAGIGLCGGLIGGLTGRSGDNDSSDQMTFTEDQSTPNNPAPSPSADEDSTGQDSKTISPEIYDYIKSIAPDGAFAIDFFPESYQHQALEWLEEDCAIGCSQDQLRQRYVLACIYLATNAVRSPYTDYEIGVNREVFPWLDETGWFENEDECDWAGISCNVDGLIESIDLHDNLLTGKFPPEVVLLKDSLKYLDLESNLVYNVDDELNWLGELTNLETLNVAQTPFEYVGIPSVIGKLTNLVHLDVSYSLFFGPLDPTVFEKLENLEYLHIGGNSYNSTIPSTISILPNLLYFYAEYADLEGDLSFIKDMPKIFELWIDRNPKMSGTIPPEIGDLVTLESLSLTDCGLTGSVPTEMGKLYRMQQMWLYGNQLDGQIPETLGNLTRMNRFELENNNLEGDMPSSVCNLFGISGRLEILEADCDNKIKNCDCCTCCGPQCSFEASQPSDRNNVDRFPGSDRHRRLGFLMEQRSRRML
jgi:hypothetical protein